MPSRRSQLKYTVATGLAMAALAAPAAHAGPMIEAGSGYTGEPVDPEPTAVTTTIDEGFDWGSAAIGAGGASALLVLVSLGAMHHASHPRGPRLG
jgi:hypothetical protein